MAELLILLAILAGAIWLDHAIQVRSRSSAPSSHDSPLPPAAGDYLRSVETELDLPAGDRDSVRAELADHLADSIAAITAEGLDADRATREALARLGNPGELARSINAAHRSTRRLLAGAAGGVFEAGFGAVYGYVVAFLIMAIVAIVAGTALRPVLDAVSKALPGVSAAVADPAVFGAVLWGAAFMAGRRSVQTLTRASRRGWGEVGRWWALAGFALLAWVLLFVLTAEQTWLRVAVESVIPVAFAAGVLLAPDRPLPLTRLHAPKWLVVATIVVLPVAMYAGLTVGTTGSSSWSDDGRQAPAINRLMPAWQGDIGLEDRWGAVGGPVIDETWQLRAPAVLSSLHDFRFELWRAVPLDNSPDWAQVWIPDTGYATPYATESVDVSSGKFTARFDVGHVRTTRWLVLLTAVGPDGVRYRVDWRSECPTSFSGTIWDWLTAGS